MPAKKHHTFPIPTVFDFLIKIFYTFFGKPVNYKLSNNLKMYFLVFYSLVFSVLYG